MKFTYNLVWRGKIAETCERKNPNVVNENAKMLCDGGEVIEIESALYGTSGAHGLGKHICQVNIAAPIFFYLEKIWICFQI